MCTREWSHLHISVHYGSISDLRDGKPVEMECQARVFVQQNELQNKGGDLNRSENNELSRLGRRRLGTADYFNKLLRNDELLRKMPQRQLSSVKAAADSHLNLVQYSSFIGSYV